MIDRRRRAGSTQLAFARRRRTPVTSWSCCRSAAASTGCRSSSRAATRTSCRCGRTSGSRTRSCCRSDDPRFGLHPAMAPLMPMWNAGTFGAVHAVGQVEPDALALRGDGGDGEGGARLVAAHRLDRPDGRARPARAPRSPRRLHHVDGAASSPAPAPSSHARLDRRLRPGRRRRRQTARGGRTALRDHVTAPAPHRRRPGAGDARRVRRHGVDAQLPPGERRDVRQQRPRRGAARRGPADQGRRGPAGRRGRLRRLGHARRPRARTDNGWMHDKLTELSARWPRSSPTWVR